MYPLAPDIVEGSPRIPENIASVREVLGDLAVAERERLQAAYARGKERLQQAEDRVEDLVREKPLRCLAVAAVIGLLAGILAGRRLG